MFQLFKRIPAALELMAAEIGGRIVTESRQLPMGVSPVHHTAEDYLAAFEGFIALRGKYERMIMQHFDGNPVMKAAMESSHRQAKCVLHQSVYDTVKMDVLRPVLSLIHSYRCGVASSFPQLCSAVTAFISFATAAASNPMEANTIVECDFERYYLDSLRDTYEAKSYAELNREGGHYTYLAWVEHHFQLEWMLANQLLYGYPRAMERVMNCMKTVCVLSHLNAILLHPDSGVSVLLEDWNEAALHQMFQFFKKWRPYMQEPIMMFAHELTRTFVAQAEKALEKVSESPECSLMRLEQCLALHDGY